MNHRDATTAPVPVATKLTSAALFVLIVSAVALQLALEPTAKDKCMTAFTLMMPTPMFLAMVSALLIGLPRVLIRRDARWLILFGLCISWGHGIYTDSYFGRSIVLSLLETAEPVVAGALLALLFLVPHQRRARSEP